MSTFTNGTTATATLDEQDTLKIAGTARLLIQVGVQPAFETSISGGPLTFGPFGAVTVVIIHGLGLGTYTQQPSNYQVQVGMVDMSPAQIASPTAAQLAATNILYQLNAPPYTIYQSNGTGMTAIGAGTGGGGATSNAPTPVTYSSTLPLDGNKYSTGYHTISTNEVLSVGAVAEGGSYYFYAVGDGAHSPNTNAFFLEPASSSYNPSAGRINRFIGGYLGGTSSLLITDMGTFVPYAPSVSTSPAIVAAAQGVATSYTSGTYAGYPVPTLTSRQWKKDGVAISGAVSATYTPIAGDATHTLTVEEVFTNSSGSVTGVSNGVTVTAIPAPVFSAQSAPAGTQGTAYTYTFTASNTTSFAVASGALPSGLTLGTSTGVLSGTPSAAGTYTFVVSATGSGGTTNSTSQSVVVSVSAATYLNFTTFDGGAAGGGSGPYTVSTGNPNNHAMTANLKMGAGNACQFIVRLDALASVNPNVAVIVDPIDNTTAAGPGGGSHDFIALAWDPGTTSYYWDGIDGFGGITGSTVPTVLDQIKVVKTSGTTPTITVSLSQNGGSSWLTGHTSTGSNIDYFIKLAIGSQGGGNTTVTLLSQTGLTATP